MVGIIWAIIIIISIIITIIFNSGEAFSNTILSLSYKSLKDFIIIGGNLILWSGLLELITRSGFLKKIAGLLRPLICFLFKTKNEEIRYLLASNIICNVLSLGGAAAPFAMKAFRMLKEENNNLDTETYDMTMLLIINSGGFSILPSTVLAIRINNGGVNNITVILFVMLVSIITTVVMVIIHRVIGWK